MNIFDFVKQYKNHPVLFVGTGLSLRYLENSFSWNDLLKNIAFCCDNGERRFYDLRYKFLDGGRVDYPKIATELELIFDEFVSKSEDAKFKGIVSLFYENMKEKGVSASKMKLYIAQILNELKYKKSMLPEISEFKKIRKNIGSVVTTNYDNLIEDVFGFTPLIGNHILLSNPYGSVYKIHGSITAPEEIIITENDYKKFKAKYDLINAQLLSLFIHNPIIFIGYSISDENIREILKTIFSCINPDSDEGRKVCNNFLLVEHDKNSTDTEVVEHDIVIDMQAGSTVIRINKIKTDNFLAIFEALEKLTLPVSAMDVRKVQSVVRDICQGDGVKVMITEDLDELKNSDKVLAIGSNKTINYWFLTIKEMMKDYFKIVEESNSQIIELANKQTIKSDQYFPVFAFSAICKKLERVDELKHQQIGLIAKLVENRNSCCRGDHTTVEAVYRDVSISDSRKITEIICSIVSRVMNLNDVEIFLKQYDDKFSTDYRKILCAYDVMKYEPTAFEHC